MRALVSRYAFACVLVVSLSSSALAQPEARRLLDPAPDALAQPRGRSVAETRHALKRLAVQTLSYERIQLALFDDVQVTAQRTSTSHPRKNSTLWHGRLEAPHSGDVTLAMVDGVVSGSLIVDGRMFEIGAADDRLHIVREVNPALFPTEDPPYPPSAPDLLPSGTAVSDSTATQALDSGGQIDVMVIWTPAARTAAGGTTAAIQSLVDLAVANANASYARSQIGTTLRLVYSGEVDFTETTTSIGTDLSRLAGTVDGYIDGVHTLRNQYGADVVTLLGAGYAARGSCGVAYVMTSVSTAFASNAFNVVDQSCAGGYLSYAHEVGHNQGLQHDPANAGSASYPYAYGFQDPWGGFRTVMAYGSAARVQQFSNPSVLYSGRPTGTSSQDNARALNNNAATVANFRPASATAPCTYTVSRSSLSFTPVANVAFVEVFTGEGCTWTATHSTPWMWLPFGEGGSGSGVVVVVVLDNPGGDRSTTATIAGQTVPVFQSGSGPGCTFSVSPLSVTLPSAGGTAYVGVTTQSGCSWIARSSPGWLTVTGGGVGSGAVAVEAGATVLTSARSTVAIVAGQVVTITQSVAGKKR